MSKMIDTDSIAKLAKKLDDRAAAKVQLEEDRAMIAEAVLDAKINNKQDKTDNTLNTEDKTIVGAINELDSEVFDIAANVISLDTYKADKTYVDEQINGINNNGITEEELDALLEEVLGINSKNELVSVRLGNYQMKYNNANDTLDFLYNATDVTHETLDLDWLVGYSLDGTTGEQIVDEADAITDFIFYDNSSEYLLSKDTVQNFRYYFYDKDKAFISRTESDNDVSTTDSKIAFPENTAYFRLKLVRNGILGSELDSHVSLKKTVTFVNNGLSMYIDADDAATYGSIRDITGNKSITNNGVTTTLDNGCLNFVASNSNYIDTGFVPNLTKWSAELYFYFRSAPAATTSVCAWGLTGNKFRIGYSGSANVFSTQTCSSENRKIANIEDMLSLRHLIVTMDNGNLIAYLDGVKMELATNESVLTPHTTTMKIGCKYDASSEFADINLKLFRFYDGKVLTEDEALRNYNYEINKTPEPGTEEIIPLSWAVGNLSSTGAEKDQDNAARSDFVAIEDNYDYTFYMNESMYDPSGVRVYFYNSDKGFISRTDGNVLVYTNGVDIPIDMPSEAAYIRFKANTSGTTTVDTIGTLFTLRKTKSYIKDGLSLYINADDVATYGSIRDITGKQSITNNGVSTVLDNGCLNFVKSESDYIDTGLVPNLTTWSVEFYFYFTDTPTITSVLCGWGANVNNKIRICYTGTLNALVVRSNETGDKRISSNPDSLVGSLHHLVVTKNNNIIVSYLDGVKIELDTNAINQTSHTGTLKIGCKYNGTEQFANIHLKSFRFYDGKALTEDEALRNYNYEINRNIIIIKPTWIDEKSLSSGTVVSNVDAMITEPIKIDENYNYTISYTTNVTEVRITSYDVNEAFISRSEYLTSGSVDTLIEFPEGAAYFRIKVEKVGITVDQADDNVILKKVHK